MNVYFMKTKENDVCFKGRMNEDVNAYLYLGQRGKFIFTINDVSVKQSMTQAETGGMTDLYSENGTYQKSFYSVIVSPSNIKISSMGNVNERLHHKIDWGKAVPKLIREKIKK